MLQSKDADEAMNAQRAVWRSLQAGAATPLDQYRRERSKGVLFLDSLRVRMGDDAFLTLMRDYFAANTTKTVTAESFLAKAGLTRVAAHLDAIDPPDGPAYLVNDIWRRLPSAVIVYGTCAMRARTATLPNNCSITSSTATKARCLVYKDFEVSDDLLRHRNVVFVGRPEANSALARWSTQLGLDYDGATFRINGDVHASEREALILATENPLDPTCMVLLVAGNDALSTVKAQNIELTAHQYVIFRDGDSPVKGFLAPGTTSLQRARTGN